MRFIDTHAHLYLEDFTEDFDEIVQRSQEVGIDKILLPNIDNSTTTDCLRLHESYPSFFYSMIGLHPGSVGANWRSDLEEILDSAEKNIDRIVAIGEIGMDGYWDKTFLEEQELALRMQVEFALKNDLPIVLHSRETTDQILEVLEEESYKASRGIFHCFTGTYEQAKRIVDLGFYLGIGGVLTYKKVKLYEVLAQIGLEHLVLETDAPYLSPVPKRGKRNESSFLLYTAEFLADRLGVPLERVSEQTTLNALRIFDLDD